MHRERESLRIAAITYSLQSTPLFNGISEADLRDLASFAFLKRLAKGQYLFHEGDPAAGFYLVRKGLVKIYRIAPDGREQIIHLFHAGETLAEAAIVSEGGYPAHAQAVEESEVILILKQEFLQFLNRRQDLALRMLTSLSMHLRDLVTTLDGLRLKDAETRLIHWILKRCPTRLSEEPVHVPI